MNHSHEIIIIKIITKVLKMMHFNLSSRSVYSLCNVVLLFVTAPTGTAVWSMGNSLRFIEALLQENQP